jgi:hypothetical protein
MRYLIASVLIALGALLAVTVYVGAAPVAQGTVSVSTAGAAGDTVVGNQRSVPVLTVKGGGGGGGGGGKSMHGSGNYRGGGFSFGLGYPYWGYPSSGYSDSSPVGKPSCVWNGYKWSCYDPAGNLL